MLIQLTNSCNMGCPHCMQNSRLGQFHMNLRTLNKAMDFAEFLGSKIINISGGEPTEHPNFKNLMTTVFKRFKDKAMVVLITNGEWFSNNELYRYILRNARAYKNFVVQVTSVEYLYPKYDEVIEAMNNRPWKPGNKLFFIDKMDTMCCLGRAKNNERFIKKSDDFGHGPSCVNALLAAKQIDNPLNWGNAEMQGFNTCKPLVDWKGNVHQGESIYCKGVGNVNKDKFSTIYDNLRYSNLCLKCRDSIRLLVSDKNKHVLARTLLGFNMSPINNIDWDSFRCMLEAAVSIDEGLKMDELPASSVLKEYRHNIQLIYDNEYDNVYNSYSDKSVFINHCKYGIQKRNKTRST